MQIFFADFCGCVFETASKRSLSFSPISQMNVFCRFEYYTIPPLLFIMNVFWFWKILKGALSLLSKTKKKS